MLETQSERFMEFPTANQMNEREKQMIQDIGNDETDAVQAVAAAGGRLSRASSSSQDKRRN